MADIAPVATYHYTEIGIKDDDLTKAKLAQPLVGVRQTGFEDGNNIESETDEGHTGTGNLDMGSFRKSAESAPSWEDGLRYGQGFEDYIYLLLPDKTITADSVSGLYNHTYECDPEEKSELHQCTIYHGFSETDTDARIFNNQMLNEFELTLSDADLPKVKVTFVGDYNNPNMINPTRHLLADHLARTVMAQHTHVYIGEVGASIATMLETPIDCFTEATLTVNHNAESKSCHGDDFGVNSKTMGQRELTGSIQMPWVDGTKYFETEYECYNKYGHIVSTEITQKQLLYVCEGGNIVVQRDSDTLGTGETLVDTKTIDGDTVYFIATGKKYKTMFLVPVVEVTKVTSTKSGSEAKDLTFEFKGIEQADQSYLTVTMLTDLASPHIDSVGTTLESFYPDPSVYTQFATS